MIEYSWWGGDNPPPANLKTKKQLAELGLSAKSPVAFIDTSKYRLNLYDPENPESAKPKRKCSPAQLENLAAQREKQKRKAEFREWYEGIGFIETDRVDAIRWAKGMVKKDFVILDTETTGLGNAEIVEIAILDKVGNALVDTLIKPSIPIPAESSAIHGITDEMVKDAPAFPEVWPQITDALRGKHLLVYNLEFDINILNYCRKLYGLPTLGLKKKSSVCLMEWYSQFVGQWSQHYRSYRWQALNDGHRAKGDCLAALEVLQKMAAADETFWCPAPELLPEVWA